MSQVSLVLLLSLFYRRLEIIHHPNILEKFQTKLTLIDSYWCRLHFLSCSFLHQPFSILPTAGEWRVSAKLSEPLLGDASKSILLLYENSFVVYVVLFFLFFNVCLPMHEHYINDHLQSIATLLVERRYGLTHIQTLESIKIVWGKLGWDLCFQELSSENIVSVLKLCLPE